MRRCACWGGRGYPLAPVSPLLCSPPTALALLLRRYHCAARRSGCAFAPSVVLPLWVAARTRRLRCAGLGAFFFFTASLLLPLVQAAAALGPWRRTVRHTAAGRLLGGGSGAGGGDGHALPRAGCAACSAELAEAAQQAADPAVCPPKRWPPSVALRACGHAPGCRLRARRPPHLVAHPRWRCPGPCAAFRAGGRAATFPRPSMLYRRLRRSSECYVEGVLVGCSSTPWCVMVCDGV